MAGNKSKRSHGARAEAFIKRSGLAVDGDGTLRKKKPGAYNPAAVGMAIVQERHMAGARAGHFRRTATAKKVVARGEAAAAASPPGGGEASSVPKPRAALVVCEESPEYVAACRAFQATLDARKAEEAAKKAAAAAALAALRERRQAFIAKFGDQCKRLLPRFPVQLREMAARKAANATKRLVELRAEHAEFQERCFFVGRSQWTTSPDALSWGWGDIATDREAEAARLERDIKMWSNRARALSLHPFLKFTPPVVALPAKLSRREAEVAATAALAEEIRREATPAYLVAREEGDVSACVTLRLGNLRHCVGKEQLIRAHKDITALVEGLRCRLAAKQGVYIPTTRDKKSSTGFAFINFATTEDCHKCMAAFRAMADGVWLFDRETNTERQLMPEYSVSRRKSSAEMAAEAAAKVKAEEAAKAAKAAIRAAMAGSMGDGATRTIALVTGRAGKTAFTVVEASAAAAGDAPKLAPVNLGATAKARKAAAEAAHLAEVKAQFAAMFATPLVAAPKPNRLQLAVSFKQVTAMAALPPPVAVVVRTVEEDMAAGIYCGAKHPDYKKQQQILRRRQITDKAELLVEEAMPFEGYGAGEAERAVRRLIREAAGSKVFTPFRG